MNTEVEKLVEKFVEDIQRVQSEQDLITKELKRFAANKGYLIKEPRKVNIRLEHKYDFSSMLHQLTLITNSKCKNRLQFIDDILEASLYFIELEYDSPDFRKEEMKLWEDCKQSIERRIGFSKSLFDQHRLSYLKKRIKDRKSWMTLRRKHRTGDFSYREDRRDLHGILFLQKHLTKNLKIRHKVRFKTFAPKNCLHSQNRSLDDAKLNSAIVICHIMYFLGFDSYRGEESVTKIIKKYYNGIMLVPKNKGAREINLKNYTPTLPPLPYSERVLWEVLHLAEKGYTTSELEDYTIHLEYLIVYYWKSSLIDILPHLDKYLLAEYICKKCKLPSEYGDASSIIFYFQTNLNVRNN